MARHMTKGIPDSLRQDGWWLAPFERYGSGNLRRLRRRAAMCLFGMAILTGLLVGGSLEEHAQEGFSQTAASHSLALHMNSSRHPE